MFMNIMQFPPIKEGKDAEFREWFAWSNKEYAAVDGFISRKLLKARKGGKYVAVIEHESFDTFVAMHSSDQQAEASVRLEPLLEVSPKPEFYDVVVE